jgi:orotate phosphoribosyltransferase
MPETHARDETRQILTDCGALLTEDHFVYASGDHGAGWIALDLLKMNPRSTARLGELLAAACADLDHAPEILCGPAIGGVICAQVTALAMNVPFVYAERAHRNGKKCFELRRGFGELVAGREVLMVDDVVNTGFSFGLTIDAVREAGGTVSAAAVWINRKNVYAHDLGVDTFVFLDEVELPSWPAEECQLCAKGMPVNTQYAHGAEFVAARG